MTGGGDHRGWRRRVGERLHVGDDGCAMFGQHCAKFRAHEFARLCDEDAFAGKACGAHVELPEMKCWTDCKIFAGPKLADQPPLRNAK